MASRQENLFGEVGESHSPPGGKSRRSGSVVKGRVKVHDPFELVRWLALSQPDPRKALAELLQNSLDAGARTIRVVRERRRKVVRLRILDDGEGVIPDLSRTEALHYIATNIGHSRKRRLSVHERYELMTQGQYGIGLLGFWSLGEHLEMRTSVPGERPYRLVLRRNRPEYRIEPLPGRRPAAEGRWTEILVGELSPEAVRAVGGRRASTYLAAELRGQLLTREVDLVIDDKIARGRAEKMFVVRPMLYQGEALDGPSVVPVPGHPPIRLEIHLVDEGSSAAPLAVFGAGTRVAESFAELTALNLDRSPWTDPRLTGHVDFAAFTIAPGSRRGIVADGAAAAFKKALGAVEPMILEALERRELRQKEELDKRLVKDLRRAFRGLFRRESRYTLLPVRESEGGAGLPTVVDEEAAPGPGEVIASSLLEHLEPLGDESAQPDAEDPRPVQSGPLAAIEVRPFPVRLACGTARRIRAYGVDASGARLREPVDYLFRLQGEGADLIEEASGRILLRAGDEPAELSLTVLAASADAEARNIVPVEVHSPSTQGRGDEGIPEPELIDVPGADWRSRLHNERWQVNTAHAQYRAVRDHPQLKVRYLALLFAKEVVLRSLQDPRLEGPLEQLVEVASYADRNLSVGRRVRARGRPE